MDKRIKVWTYWHSEDRPEIVNECIASWRRHLDHNKFEIIVLSEDNIHQYLSPDWIEQIPDFQRLNKANQSDFIRLSLLKFYGGVWMDASIHLLQDLSFIENFNEFYAPRFPFVDHSNVQVFFLVAPKNDEMINKWLGLYTDVLRNKQKVRNKWYRLTMYSGVGLSGLILVDEKFRTYFKVYEVYASLYSSDAAFRENTPSVDEYGMKTSFRQENLVKLLKVIGLYFLHKLVGYVTVSQDPLKLKQRAQDIFIKKQHPSVTLERNGKIIFYKLNAADRNQLAPDFRFEQEPGLSKSDNQSL